MSHARERSSKSADERVNQPAKEPTVTPPAATQATPGVVQASPHSPVRLSPTDLITLQRTIGNRQVSRMLDPRANQPVVPGLQRQPLSEPSADEGESHESEDGRETETASPSADGPLIQRKSKNLTEPTAAAGWKLKGQSTFADLKDAVKAYNQLDANSLALTELETHMAQLMTIQGLIQSWYKKHGKVKKGEDARRQEVDTLSVQVPMEINAVSGQIRTAKLRMEQLKEQQRQTTVDTGVSGVFDAMQTAGNNRIDNVLKDSPETAQSAKGDTSVLKTQAFDAFNQEIVPAVKETRGLEGAHKNAAFKFRNETKSMALMSAYANRVGKDYLKDTILPTLSNALSRSKSVEIDPNKIEKGDDTGENTTALLGYYRELMAPFSGAQAATAVPAAIKEIAWTMYSKTVEAGGEPHEGMMLASSMMFLRFINPLLTTLAARLSGTPNQRTLLLLSKVLQNQANDVQFGSKEAYMQVFNPLMTEYKQGFSEFLEAVVKGGAPKT